MPYTSYNSYNYPNYATGRPYSGSKTYTSFEPSTTSPYSSTAPYKLSQSSATNFTTPSNSTSTNLGSNSYGLRSPTSSSVLNRNDSKNKRPSAVPVFLSGNTASLRKAFGNKDASVTDEPPKPSAFTPSGYRLRRNEERTTSPPRRYGLKDSTVRPYGRTTDASKNVASNYIRRLGNTDPPKPKEILSTEINLSSKPPLRGKISSDSNNENLQNDAGEIFRNRQAVRLTIKRDKGKNIEEPYEVKRNSITTVAKKLLDKYTITDDKKPSGEPLSYGPRDRVFLGRTTASADSSSSSDVSSKYKKADADTKDPPYERRKWNATKEIKAHQTEKPDEGGKPNYNTRIYPESSSNEINSVNRSSSGNNIVSNYSPNKRKLSKPGAELEDGVVVFSRATESAVNKKEIESAEEVKDIIVAAALHPDIDIESDDEIKRLIEADTSGGEESLSSPTTPQSLSKSGTNLDNPFSGKKINPIDSLLKSSSKNSVSSAGLEHCSPIMDSTSQDGTIIVDKLKRFVKKQVSIKRTSIKREHDCNENESRNPDIISVKLKGSKNLISSDKDTCEAASSNELMEKAKKKSRKDSKSKKSSSDKKCSEKCNSNFLTPFDALRAEERSFKKSPTPQLALKEGMEKIKISISVCDNIVHNKEDRLSSGSNDGSARSSIGSCSEVGAISGSLTLTGNSLNDAEIAVPSARTCLQDAPWRKKLQGNINKSKTSANIVNDFNSQNDDDDFWGNINASLAKSPSAFALDSYSSRNKSPLTKTFQDIATEESHVTNKPIFETKNLSANKIYSPLQKSSSVIPKAGEFFGNETESFEGRDFNVKTDLGIKESDTRAIYKSKTTTKLSQNIRDLNEEDAKEGLSKERKNSAESNSLDSSGCWKHKKKNTPPLIPLQDCSGLSFTTHNKKFETLIRLQDDSSSQVTDGDRGASEGVGVGKKESMPEAEAPAGQKANEDRISPSASHQINDSSKKSSSPVVKCPSKEFNFWGENTEEEGVGIWLGRQDEKVANAKGKGCDKLSNSTKEDREFEGNNDGGCRSEVPALEGDAKTKLDEQTFAASSGVNENDAREKNNKIALKSSTQFPKLNKEPKVGSDKNIAGLKVKRGVSNKWLEEKKEEDNKSYAYVVKDNNRGGAEEIMNARNVLKRPQGLDKNNKTLPKSDQSNGVKLPESNLKKQPAWKKPTTSNEKRTPGTTGADEIRQLRNVLKRPGPTHKLQIPQTATAPTSVNTATTTTTAKPASISQSVENGIGEAPKAKKLRKKKQSQGSRNKEQKNDSSDDEGGGGQWQVSMRRPPILTQKLKAKTSEAIELSLATAPPAGVLEDTSGCESKKSSSPLTSKDETTPFSKNNDKICREADGAVEADNLIGLSASKSADSAYGSIPSTPLTTAGKAGAGKSKANTGDISLSIPTEPKSVKDSTGKGKEEKHGKHFQTAIMILFVKIISFHFFLFFPFSRLLHQTFPCKMSAKFICQRIVNLSGERTHLLCTFFLVYFTTVGLGWKFKFWLPI